MMTMMILGIDAGNGSTATINHSAQAHDTDPGTGAVADIDMEGFRHQRRILFPTKQHKPVGGDYLSQHSPAPVSVAGFVRTCLPVLPRPFCTTSRLETSRAVNPLPQYRNTGSWHGVFCLTMFGYCTGTSTGRLYSQTPDSATRYPRHSRNINCPPRSTFNIPHPTPDTRQQALASSPSIPRRGTGNQNTV